MPPTRQTTNTLVPPAAFLSPGRGHTLPVANFIDSKPTRNLALSAKDFAKIIGVGRTTFFMRVIRRERLRPVFVAGVKRWLIEDAHRIIGQAKIEREAA
mgnify:CR=1 FL=1